MDRRAYLDDRRGRDRQAGFGQPGHQPADPLRAGSRPGAGEPTSGKSAAVGQGQPMRGARVPPPDGLGRADG